MQLVCLRFCRLASSQLKSKQQKVASFLIVMDRAGFFPARLGLGLRTLSPFGLGLLALKNRPERARVGPVRALKNIGCILGVRAQGVNF